MEVKIYSPVGKVAKPAKKTRNAWQSIAYSPSALQCRPLASSSKPKPGYHLAIVQRMHVVSVCLHCGNII